ncbi:MAG TPA: hypothetical protein VJ850_08510 [Candidatus Limnocylindrales bacterium]|nr:hypothetical protein [Candidatus Limnocylindrales bacterium]
MSDAWQYVIAMKSLPSEYRALRTLAAEVSSATTPLIQLWDRAPSPDVEEEGEELDAGQAELALVEQQTVWEEAAGDRVWRRFRGGLFPKTRPGWPVARRFLLDGEWLEDPDSLSVVIGHARARDLDVVPVTGLVRSAEYQDVVSKLASPDRGGLVVRLVRADFTAGPRSLDDKLSTVLRASGVSTASTDVILDLRSVDNSVRERDEANVEAMLRLLPDLEQWRNVAVIASGAPRQVDAKRFPQNELTPYPRPEWWIWRELRSRLPLVARIPTYGDYGTHHPEKVEAIGGAAGGKKLPRIPQIRYASSDSMLMLRGHDLRGRDDGDQQLREMLDRLKEYGAAASANYSAGDAWLQAAANGEESPGSWPTWKWAGQVHGITHAVTQLASLDGP